MAEYTLKSVYIDHNKSLKNPPEAMLIIAFRAPGEKDKHFSLTLGINLNDPVVTEKFNEEQFKGDLRARFSGIHYASPTALESAVQDFIIQYKSARKLPIYGREISRAKSESPFAVEKLGVYFQDGRWYVQFQARTGDKITGGLHSTGTTTLTDDQRELLRNMITQAVYHIRLTSISELHQLIDEVLEDHQRILKGSDVRLPNRPGRPFKLPVRHKTVGIFTLHGPYFQNHDGQLDCGYSIGTDIEAENAFCPVTRRLGITADQLSDPSLTRLGQERIAQLEAAIVDELKKASDIYGHAHYFHYDSVKRSRTLTNPEEMRFFEELKERLPHFAQVNISPATPKRPGMGKGDAITRFP